MRKFFAITIIIFSFSNLLAFPAITDAETASIRQEINIIDAAIAGATTSPEQVQLDTTQYQGSGSSTGYYFEVLASITGGQTATATLQRVGSTTNDATVSISASSLTLSRVAFSPPVATTTQYDVNVALSGGTVAVKAARIIVLQGGNPIKQTETQVEIGDNETGKTNTATSTGALTAPKYWYYKSAQWGGTVNAYAEVTYSSPAITTTTKQVFVSSTVLTTWTIPADWGNVSNTIEVIGGGGGGGVEGSTNRAGGGGGGGAYAEISNFATTTGNIIKIQVGKGGASNASGTVSFFNWDNTGSTSTCNGTHMSVCAAFGGHGLTTTLGSGGTQANSSGTLTSAGGNGGSGSASTGTRGAGGGGAGGSHGSGNVGQNQSASGGQGGSGDAGSGGAGGATSTSPGGAGGVGGEWVASAYGSGGGGGGGTSNPATGGQGGLYGGGGSGGSGTGAGGAGAQGIIVVTYVQAATSTATFVLQRSTDRSTWTDVTPVVNAQNSTSAARVRASFAPVDGNFYRIVGMAATSTYPYNVYSAKIIIDQSGTPKTLEPQYLLLDTTAANQTTDQAVYTTWNPNEWAGANNTYVHQVDASSTASSTVNLLNFTASTTLNTITGATTTVTSTIAAMPNALSTIDISIPQNATNTYADRILVDVTLTAPTNSHGIQVRGGGGGIIQIRGGGSRGSIKIRGGQ